jgi:hypothetical protein
VTVGAYSDGTWHCSLVEDTYERGQPLNSDMVAILWGDETEIRQAVERALDALVLAERTRIEAEAGAPDSSQNGAPV